MRITILDKQMSRVVDITEVDAATFFRESTYGAVADLGRRYNHTGFRWFVTADGEMPLNCQHDGAGVVQEQTPFEKAWAKEHEL